MSCSKAKKAIMKLHVLIEAVEKHEELAAAKAMWKQLIAEVRLLSGVEKKQKWKASGR